jgi:biopolymer transport protein ExbD
VETNLFPVMNLMVVLIPLLLSTATYVRIGVIELDLPPAASGQTDEAVLPSEEERSLDLAVSITEEGFYISSALAVLTGPEGGPYIPKRLNDNNLLEYDFNTLSNTLFDIKGQAQGRFPDYENIIIQADLQIRYQVLVHTIDAARSIQRDGQVYQLFPRVSLSAGVM